MTNSSAWRQTLDETLSQPRAELALRLTALWCVVDAAKFVNWHPAAVVVPFIALAMLVSPRLLKDRAAWSLLFLVMAFGLTQRWSITGNHGYFNAYWALACALAAAAPDCDDVLSTNARLLVGLAFALAAAQKLLHGEYLNGSFMHGLALWDGRFKSVAILGGGLDAAALRVNEQLKAGLSFFPSEVQSVRLLSSERLRWTATALSYWVLLVEGTIGLSFLSRRPGWLHEKRDWFLMSFIIPTYVVAQIPEFGMLLAVMGYAQCAPERRTMRLAYLTAFCLLSISSYTIPPLLDAALKLLS